MFCVSCIFINSLLNILLQLQILKKQVIYGRFFIKNRMCVMNFSYLHLFIYHGGKKLIKKNKS